MAEIAVFTTSIDEPTYIPVVRIMESKGFTTFVYNGDKVASQEHEFSYTIDDNMSSYLFLQHLVFFQRSWHEAGSVSRRTHF